MTSTDITPGDFLVTFCGAYVDSWRGYGPQAGPGWSQTEACDSHEAAFEARARMERECREYYGAEFMRWCEIGEMVDGEFHRWNYTDYSKNRAKLAEARARIAARRNA